ncbi:hypothetical protein AQUCO_02000112v1 [Aquilegia coerulea]|uniref:Uncharacterized protein n=1 Tax=Aquilegia coerulea TaxID=218851 RepID=A0A2G5DFY9_AQUCA|nr:hypothetical protein AQUCO_02000112v1 [Aquilegia coerulea]
MLIRSSSTPILNSWVSSYSVELSPEPDLFHHIQKTQSISLTTITSSFSSHSPNKITRARSENDLRDLVIQKRNSFNQSLNKFIEDEEEQDLKKNFKFLSMNGLFSSSRLDELVEEEEEYVGGGIGSNGGKCNGGGGDGFSDFNNGNDETDAYYQKMIESNPGNGLLLGNYAKFLKEVRGDLVKAEEYCERAILVNPNDANVTSLYGDLIWEIHKDASRAEKYYDQAVQAEPNDW